MLPVAVKCCAVAGKLHSALAQRPVRLAHRILATNSAAWTDASAEATLLLPLQLSDFGLLRHRMMR